MIRRQSWRAMLADPRARRLGWTFTDQGVMSLGMFLVQVILARTLPPSEYGVFVLILSALLTLQIVNATIIFYPMSVLLPGASEAERPGLLGASLLLLLALSIALGVALALGLALFGRFDLMLPSLLFFLGWQAQEGLRRGLFGSFRYASACIGDTATYFGQAALTASLAFLGILSIANVFYAMAITATLGAMLHAGTQCIILSPLGGLRSVASRFWRLGGLTSLGNGALSQARLLVLPWALALHDGPAVAAAFQAAVNIVNLSNPLVLGLGNIIPQAVASAQQQAKVVGLAVGQGLSDGLRQAWRVARSYALFASTPILLYSLVVLAVPQHVLWLFYGSSSAYLDLDLALRLLVIGGLVSFSVEAVLSFLHGAALVRRAATINLFGTGAILLLALPLIAMFGLLGACAAMLVANLLRLLLCRFALTRLTRDQNSASPHEVPA